MNNDLISREALKEDLAKEIKTNDMGLWLKILLVIDNAPSVKFSLLPADESKEEAYMRGYEKGKIEGILKAHTRPKGEWIVLVDEDNIKTCKCSICGRIADIVDFDNYPFCHCGAKMKGGVS